MMKEWKQRVSKTRKESEEGWRGVGEKRDEELVKESER